MEAITGYANCRSCGESILFVRGFTGNLNPVNAKPKKVYILTNTFYTLVDGYESHFATCPQAAQWRKPKEGVAQEGKVNDGR
jgi:hypothetical protein